MFKCHIGITPLPINNLFTVNNAHGINIWNHMSPKITIDVSYACYTKYQIVIYNVIRFHIELHRYLEHLKYESIFDGFDIN